MTFFVSTYLLWVAIQLRIVLPRTGDPAGQLSWILATLIAPPAAAILYMVLYTSRCRTAKGSGASAVESIINAGCRTLAVEGNSVEVLGGGAAAFAAMIGDMQRARRTIRIEFYIFEDDRIGRSIMSLLRRRARAGVKVNMLCDAFGSRRLPQRVLRMLRADGIDIRRDTPLRWPFLTPAVHCRNHRKMVLIDGRTAHVGGINIANRYIDGDSMGRWHDEQIRISGAVVDDLERLFAADWSRVSGEELPRIATGTERSDRKAGRATVQAAWSEHGISRQTIADAIAAAIAQTRSSLHIVTPYFIPPPWLMDSLRRAALSGVDVRIMLPARCDSGLICRIVRGYVVECVGSGIDVRVYDEGFIHSKLIVMDGRRVMLGSANLDYRSMKYNRELMLTVDDRATARRYADGIERMYRQCRRITPEDIDSGSWRCSRTDHLARLLAPLL